MRKALVSLENYCLFLQSTEDKRSWCMFNVLHIQLNSLNFLIVLSEILNYKYMFFKKQKHHHHKTNIQKTQLPEAYFIWKSISLEKKKTKQSWHTFLCSCSLAHIINRSLLKKFLNPLFMQFNFSDFSTYSCKNYHMCT